MVLEGVGPRPAPGSRPPTPERLETVTMARERRRVLFRPKRGLVRRLERWTAHLLAHHVFPWIPGIAWPYSRTLERQLTLSQAEISLDGLPAGLDGTRVLLLSDIHAGPFLSPAVLRRTFLRLLETRPDMVVLAGDLTTSRLGDYLRFRDAFRLLRAPLGVYAVLGNHDHYSRVPERLRSEVEADGIRVLHNSWTSIGSAGATLTLAGVDDLLLGEPDLDRALAGAPRPVILLSHNPDLLFSAQRRGVSLMLSGHTHAGQIRVPGLPVIVRQSRYRLDEGRYRAGATELVVSRGLGAVGLPLRVACSPEAVLVTIRGRTES
jgi:predicted MPP superfamily phosphohydrolase